LMPPSALTLSKTAAAASDASGKVAGPLMVLTEPSLIGPPSPPSLPAQPLSTSAAAAVSAAAPRMRDFLVCPLGWMKGCCKKKVRSGRLRVRVPDGADGIDVAAGAGVLRLAVAVDAQEDARGHEVVAQIVQPHARDRDAELAEAEEVETVVELPYGRQVHIAVAALHTLQVLPGVALRRHVDVLVEVLGAVAVEVAHADEVARFARLIADRL